MLTILSNLLSSVSTTSILYFIMVLGLSAALVYEHHIGFQACQYKAIDQSLLIKDKQLEISTNHPSLDVLLKRMYAGTE